MDGAPHILSAGMRKTIQKIKEIVGNHSDADIYVALKETNMDPNETTQKLLNQDPFHEVRRRKDKKKENAGFRTSTASEPGRNPENVAQVTGSSSRVDCDGRKNASNRSILPDAGMSREFRVVRDNRFNSNSITESKLVPVSTPVGEPDSCNGYVKSSSGNYVNEKLPFERLGPQTTNGTAVSQPRQVRGRNSNNTTKEVSGGMQQEVVTATTQTQAAKPLSTTSSINSVIGVYSSSSDPVHVPSPDSRPAAKIGAIKREVGIVGANCQTNENSAKLSSSHDDTSSNSHLARDGTSSRESLQSSNTIVKSDPSSQTLLPESTVPSLSTSRSFSNSQYNGRSHQLVGHRNAPQPNKEWKPKSSQKSAAANGSGVTGMPAQTASPVDISNTGAEIAQVTDQVSRVNIAENENVIIASHIRVSETDRSRLSFGSLGTGLEPRTSVIQPAGNSEKTFPQTSECLPGSSAPEPIAKLENDNHLDLIDDHLRNSGSVSPASVSASDQGLLEKKEASTPENLDNYADLQLVRASSPSYVSPEVQQQQDTAELQSFSSYDPQTGYDMPHFRPVIEEHVRGQGLASPQEALYSYPRNNIPSSSMAMLQQQQLQQQALVQMYQQPHLRVSPFPTNIMPYRQYISPMYVPQMPISAYSGNPAYPHPSNGNGYMLMTGNSSHLHPSTGVKFGIQHFKPLPGGSPVLGNFTNPSGYAISTPGVVGNPAGLDESSRLKYKDGNLYVPTPPVKAETSEIWMNPRDMQSASYYNMAQQTHHAAYLPTHCGNAPFNAAAAVAQSSHMPFQGLYHPPQPAGIGNPHHLGPGVGGNIGVGVAAVAAGAQVGTYQQPQIGHQNWTGNF